MAGRWAALRRDLGALLYGRSALLDDIRRLSNPIIPAFFESTDAGHETGRGYEPLDQNFRAYMDTLGLFPIVSACDDAIGSYSAAVPVKLFRGDVELEDHPLLTLLDDPNPEQGYQQFWSDMARQWGMEGNVYITCVGTPEAAPWANPQELWVLPSHRTKPVVDRSRRRRGKSESPVMGYVYDGDGGQQKFLPSQMLHIKRPNPRDPIVGLSPLKELEMALNLLFNSLQSNSKYFKNGAVPGMVLKKDGHVDKDVLKRFADQVEQQIGGVNKRGANLYLTGGWTIDNVAGNSPKDAEFIALIEMMVKWILAVKGVPPFAIGLLEHANWSNSVEQQRYFYDRAIRPFNQAMFDAMNTHMMVQAWGDSLELRHDYSGIDALSEDKDKQATRATSLYSGGIAMRDEARKMVGLEPVGPEKGGEDFYSTPAPMMPDPNADPNADPQQQSGRLAYLSLLAQARVELADGNREQARHTRWLAAVRRTEGFEAAVRVRTLRAFRRMRASVLEEVARRAGIAHLADGKKGSIDPKWGEGLFNAAEWAAETLDSLMSTLTAAIRAGAEDVAEEVSGEFVPFDVERPEVARFIAQKTARNITTVAQNRLGEVRDLVTEAAARGETVQELATVLREYFGHDVTWSQRIARTETHQLYEEGSILGMQDAGVTTKQWLTARDAAVRDTHREVDGQEVPLDGTFVVGGHSCRAPGQTGVPEEDINCFPAGTAVQGRIVAALRANYLGKMVEVTTRSGAKLTVTPNHPVLTTVGFIPAGLLCEGQYLLCHGSVGDATRCAPFEEKKDQQAPAAIEDVFDTLSAHGWMLRRNATRNDLDGDGLFFKDQIEVVGSARELSPWTKAMGKESAVHRVLVGAHVRAVQEAGKRARSEFFGGTLPTSHSLPGSAALALDKALVGLDGGPFEEFRIGPAAKIDARLAKRAGQDISSDSALVRQLLHGHSGAIALDQVTKVRQFDFSGHVYDLQSTGGWIVADGIVTSNCRCTTIAGGF
jgi:HK97 family phage portal protein